MPTELRLALACCLAVCTAADISAAQDPAATQRAGLTTAIEKHPFFKKVDFTVHEQNGFLFLVEAPRKDDPMYLRKVVNHYLPFLLELERVFERDYAVPTGLERRQDVAFYTIAILASKGSYDDYAQAVGDRGLHISRAHYDFDLRLAVTYEDLFGGGGTGGGERSAILHEFVHALQHAYSPTGRMPDALWFNEGLAEFRSSSSHVASSLRNPRPRDQHLALLANVLVEARRRSMAFPLRDLLSMTSYAAVIENARGRLPSMSPDVALDLFYAQSDLFVAFLHKYESGKHLPLFQSWMQLMMEGKGSLEALQAAAKVAETDFATLERDWLAYLTEVMRQRFGKFPDLTPLATGGGIAATGGTGGTAVPAALTTFDPETLAFTDGDGAELVVAAQLLCSRGRFDEALEVLASFESDERAARERARIEAVIALRDEVLQSYVERGSDLDIVLPEGEVEARPIAWDGSVLRVQIDDREEEPPLHCVVPWTLLKPGWRMRLFRGSDSFLDPYLRYLNGEAVDERPVSRLLRGDDAGTVALAADIDGDFDAARGGLALWLWRQQRPDLPEGPKAAREALDRLRGKLKEHGAHPLVTARKEPLTVLARALAERAFSMEDASFLGLGGVPGDAGDADDGRIRVTYDDLEHDLPADFVKEVDWDQEQIPIPRLAFQGPPQIRTRGDRFELIGSGTLNWKLPLRAPVTVEIEVEFTGDNFVMVGVCCEQERGVILCTVGGEVLIADAESQIMDQVGQEQMLYAERKYRLQIEHDGDSLKVSRDGQETARLSRVGSRKQGAVSLMVHGSNPVVIHSLTIEGVPDTSRQGELRARFVEEVLEELWK